MRINIHVGMVLSARTSQAGTGANAQPDLTVTHIPQGAKMLMNVHAVLAEGPLSVITCLEASDVRAPPATLETHYMNVQVSCLP